MMGDAEPRHHPVGMGDRAVGEDELPPRQGGQRRLEGGAGRNRRDVDLMHEIEEGVRIDVVMGHQPAQACAVLAEITLLQVARRRLLQPQQLFDEKPDAAIDLREEIAARRIERVVEIEDPVGDVVDGADQGWVR